VESGTFRDYVCRSIFLRRQQADVMKHLTVVQSNFNNSDKTNSIMQKYMELVLPYIYDSSERRNELEHAQKIMEEYANKVIEFKIPDSERQKILGNPYELTDKLSVNKR
jgi:hypothetical protein